MRLVGERVHDRDAAGRSERVHLAVRVRPDRERVEIAGEHACRIRNRLAARELQLVTGEVDRRRTEMRACDLERDARPGRVLAKQEADGAALEQAVWLPLLLLRLQLVGEIQHGVELRRGPVANACERAAVEIE